MAKLLLVDSFAQSQHLEGKIIGAEVDLREQNQSGNWPSEHSMRVATPGHRAGRAVRPCGWTAITQP
jgi:hypothetical protein